MKHHTFKATHGWARKHTFLVGLQRNGTTGLLNPLHTYRPPPLWLKRSPQIH